MTGRIAVRPTTGEMNMVTAKAKARVLGLAAATALLIAGSPAAAAVYEFSGTITSFADPRQLLQAGSVVGRGFTGTISFDATDIGKYMGNPDRIGDIVVDDVLRVATPNDGAFVQRQGPDTLFSGILPFNPVVFSTATFSKPCPGSGGVTLIGASEMKFSFGCTNMTFDGKPSLGFSLSGAGSYRLAGSVPEPSTWMLMIAGFGAVGAARRRRVQGDGGRAAIAP